MPGSTLSPTIFAVKLKFGKSNQKRLFNKIANVCFVLEAINGETRKRKRKDIDVVFPEELLVEVLSRVLVRDLVRYRSACRRWRSLIDDLVFVSTHLRNYKSNHEGSHLLVNEQNRKSYGDDQVLVRRSDTFRKDMEINNCLNVKRGYDNYRNLGYVNGIMLIRKWIYGVLDDNIFWNPSVNRSLNISNSASQDLREARFLELGLGFDATCNDLKVVAIVYPHVEMQFFCGYHYRGKVPGLVQVYALSTEPWSSNLGVHPPPYWTSGHQVFVNGGIHWMNLGPEIRHCDSWSKMSDSHIVSFDVSSEVFSYFVLPSEIVEYHDGEKSIKKFPIVLEGLLGMFCSCGLHHDVWVMEEYSVSNSWNKRYKFELQIDDPLHLKSNGELLFTISGKGIKSYDAKRNSVKDLAKTSPKSLYYYRVYTYVESLLLGCK